MVKRKSEQLSIISNGSVWFPPEDMAARRAKLEELFAQLRREIEKAAGK